MPGSNQFEDFLYQLGQLESGGNYRIVQKTSGALGKYQIMPSNWVAWSTAVFGEVADWRDPAAQEAVAQKILGDYYARYGSWALTAVAWFAGPGAADKAAANGFKSVAQMKDSIGTSVQQYVDRVVGRMDPDLAPWSPTGSPLTIDVDQTPIDYTEGLRLLNEPTPSQNPFRDTMLKLLDGMSNRIAGGQRVDVSAIGSGNPIETPDDEIADVPRLKEPI